MGKQKSKKYKKAPEKAEEMVCVSSPDKKEMVCTSSGEVTSVKASEPEKRIQRKGNIFIGTLNLFTSPARGVKGRYEEKYKTKYKHPKKIFILDIILVGLIGLLLGFNIYLLVGQTLAPRGVELDIEIPKTITSGGDSVFLVKYTNGGKEVLNTAKISLEFPEFFTLKEVIPQAPFDFKTNTFDIGNIEPGGNGQIEIIGQILGQVGSGQRISAHLNYFSEKDKKRRKKTTLKTYNIFDSALALNFNLPENVINDQEFDFEIEYRNDSENILSDLFLIPKWPEEFELIESEPALSEDGWQIKKIGPQEQGKIKAKGKILSQGLSKEFSINAWLEAGGGLLFQGENRASVSVIQPKIFVDLKVNNQKNIIINPGEVLEYSIFYQNQGEYDLHDLSIRANLKSAIFDFDKLETGGRLEGEEIIFDKENISQLALVEQGGSGEINFQIGTKSQADPLKIIKYGNTAVLQVKISFRLEEDLSKVILVSGSTVESKINSDLSLNAFARYWTVEGDQLGRGPIPPQVGEVTKYWIFWSILNNINDVENVLITAKLSTNVEWTEKISITSGDHLEYNSITKEVSWRIEKISPDSIDSFQNFGAGFEVALTPTSDQVGLEVDLLKEIRIAGKDVVTGKFIEKEIDKITTDLIYDRKAAGRGKITY